MIRHLVVDEGECVVTGATGVRSDQETSVGLSHLLQQLNSFLQREGGGEGERISTTQIYTHGYIEKKIFQCQKFAVFFKKWSSKFLFRHAYTIRTKPRDLSEL